MKQNSWEMPEPIQWLKWCTDDWNKADLSTRVAFNFYCNELLPAVNHKWKDQSTRFTRDMIDVCTVSDEVFIVMNVLDNASCWSIPSLKITTVDGKKKIINDTSVHKEGNSLVSAGRRGKRKRPDNKRLQQENTLTQFFIQRRQKGFAKQWCRQVRLAKYDDYRLNSSCKSTMHGDGQKLLMSLPDEFDVLGGN
jgi:hypothetical protein